MGREAAKLDWRCWFERWQRMQDCYVPQRRRRFDLIFQFPQLGPEDEVHILDLGCGPGSLAFHAFRHHPNARVVAVDLDPVLLEIGQHVAEQTEVQVQFLNRDVRQTDWWRSCEGRFELVVSATTLHWLGRHSLAELYQCVFRALKPGGWFMNSDHIASDAPGLQERYRQMLSTAREAAFSAASADDWDGFWNELARDLGDSEMLAVRKATEYWEGSEDGQPRQFHVSALRQCGFEPVDVIWQEMGEAIVGARRPA
ncbi:MAG TPA: methyltransferase domain-containing protein [Armatimonadota bacterium]|nr:methyltransferase domain-containing protein [Armatimonadota bacterium]